MFFKINVSSTALYIVVVEVYIYIKIQIFNVIHVIFLAKLIDLYTMTLMTMTKTNRTVLTQKSSNMCGNHSTNS